MSRDIYPTMTAATAAWQQLEHISNNLANVNTTGFKERRVSFESYMAQPNQPNTMNETYVKISDGNINDENGTLMIDNVQTHLAIEGKGFFVVENAAGERVLTRSGNFQIDRDGYLTNQMGEKVITTTGPMMMDIFQQANFQVDDTGRLLDERGGEFGRLLIVDGEGLEPLAGTRWRADNMDILSPEEYTIRQGALENSNVNPFRSMIEMLEATRHFEMYQKAMQSSKEMDSSLNQMVHKV